MYLIRNKKRTVLYQLLFTQGFSQSIFEVR